MLIRRNAEGVVRERLGIPGLNGPLYLLNLMLWLDSSDCNQLNGKMMNHVSW